MAADPDRLDRFRREAQSVAKLNREDQRSRVPVILNWTTWLEGQLAER